MGNFSSLESSQYVSDVIADRVATLVSDYLTPEKSIYLQQQMMIKNKDLTPALVQNVAPTTYITAKSTKEKTPTVQIPTFQDDDLLAAPLVFDIGSCNMRVGRAGFNNPFHTIRTVTGKLKVANQDRIFVGNDAISNKTISKVSCPIANGTVTDYESLSKIIAHGYDKLLTSDEIDSGAQPLLLSMKEQNKEMISRIAQCMFEEYNVPAMSFVHNGFASLVSEGYTSGVVVDVGHTSSNVVPIYEACTVQSNVGWTPVGGQTITNEFQRILQFEYSKNFSSSGDLETLKRFKEDIVGWHDDDYSYMLPDSTSLIIKAKHRRDACTALFSPTQAHGIHDIVNLCMQEMPQEAKVIVGNHLFYTGAPTQHFGFDAQFKQRLSCDSVVQACKNQVNSVYLGCSILGLLSTYRDAAVTKDQYMEYGTNAIHYKML